MKNNQPIRPILRPEIRVRSTSETIADQTKADHGGLRSVGSSQPTAHATNRSFFEIDTAWTPDQARKSELIAAVRAIENKSTGGFTKFVVLLVSLAVFVAAGVAWWDPWVVSLLVVQVVQLVLLDQQYLLPEVVAVAEHPEHLQEVLVVQVVVVHRLRHLLQSQLVLVDLVQQIRDLVEGMGRKLQPLDQDILLVVVVVQGVLVLTL